MDKMTKITTERDRLTRYDLAERNIIVKSWFGPRLYKCLKTKTKYLCFKTKTKYLPVCFKTKTKYLCFKTKNEACENK
jgi:hypothetical protein